MADNARDELGDRPVRSEWLPRLLILYYLGAVLLCRDYMLLESLHVYGTVTYVMLLYYIRIGLRRRGDSPLLLRLHSLQPLLHAAFLVLCLHSLQPAIRLTLLQEPGPGPWHAWWAASALLGLYFLWRIQREVTGRSQVGPASGEKQ